MTNEVEIKIKTPEQRRAKRAWNVVQEIKSDKCDEFAKLCKKTASRILNSGIIPALAFLEAKKEDGQNHAILDAFDGQLESDGLFAFAPGSQSVLLERLMHNADGAALRRAQTEALAYLEWLARFAEGRAVVHEQKTVEGGGS